MFTIKKKLKIIYFLIFELFLRFQFFATFKKKIKQFLFQGYKSTFFIL